MGLLFLSLATWALASSSSSSSSSTSSSSSSAFSSSSASSPEDVERLANHVVDKAIRASERHPDRKADILDSLTGTELKLGELCGTLHHAPEADCRRLVKAAFDGARGALHGGAAPGTPGAPLTPAEMELLAGLDDWTYKLFTSLPRAAPPHGFYVDADGPGFGDEFNGFISRSYASSKEDWPKDPELPANLPNVVVFLLDDTGFAHLGAYGGDVPTPNLDRLAANGLIYSNFHTTALCSPSRAAILAGRNHHEVGFGSHMISAMGFPGYAGRVPRSAAGVGRWLRDAGYTTNFLGKWDHTPMAEVSMAGPFDRWPTGEGFDHFYGFMAADTHNFNTVMWENHEPTEPYEGNDEYHVTEDLVDRSIRWLTHQLAAKQGTKPFFTMLATGAMHAPHHAPKVYRDRFVGKFDDGWDAARERIYRRQLASGVIPPNTKLTDRIGDIPAWTSLSADEKRLYARQMEAFAAQLAHTDYHFGRLIEALERTGAINNTLIIVTSDNGSSGEGGLAGSHNEALVINGMQTPFAENMKFIDDWGSKLTYNHFHAGWAMAGNTPFKYFKQAVHRGGQSDPLIVHWPAGIRDKGKVRHQYHHIIDLAPTIAEACGVVPPAFVDGHKQVPVSGKSMVYSFNDELAPSPRQTQYYEMYGNMAIYHEGWKAVALHGTRLPWNTGLVAPFKDDKWELYNLIADPSESTDLAAVMPEKLLSMQMKFDAEARKYNVYPLYDDLAARIAKVFSSAAPKTDTFVFYPPGAVRIIESASPPMKNRSHTIVADIAAGGDGVIVTCGGMSGGFALYVQGGMLKYTYNTFNQDRRTVQTAAPAAGAAYTAKLDWVKTGPLAGNVRLSVDGVERARMDVPFSHPSSWSAEETFDVGRDTGTPVEWGYAPPFEFSGNLTSVRIVLGSY